MSPNSIGITEQLIQSQDVLLEHTAQHIHVALLHPRQVLSSAVLNGGLRIADHILNVKVAKTLRDVDVVESPKTTLETYCLKHNWKGVTVGMMTAASMQSLHIAREIIQGIEIIALVTAGLSNPRRAGDSAEWRELSPPKIPAGTINTILLTEASLTEAALVEAVIVATEAKVVALHEMGVSSPVSQKLATGTGTDSLCVINGRSDMQVDYCGKHTMFGETLARVIIEATSASMSWYLQEHY